MAMTCPVKVCGSTGWCIHKTMMAAIMIIIIAVILWFVLR